MTEIWKDVVGYEGLYEVSNLGRIRNVGRTIIDKLGRNHPVRQCIRSLHSTPTCPYYVIVLCKGDRDFHNHLVHRIVAEAFLPDYDEDLEINHKNGNKHDNRPENLEIVTRKENIAHARNTGLVNDSGVFNSRSVLSEALVKKSRAYRLWGVSVAQLARDHNVNPGTLHLAAKGRTYKNIK